MEAFVCAFQNMNKMNISPTEKHHSERLLERGSIHENISCLEGPHVWVSPGCVAFHFDLPRWNGDICVLERAYLPLEPDEPGSLNLTPFIVCVTEPKFICWTHGGNNHWDLEQQKGKRLFERQPNAETEKQCLKSAPVRQS